MNKTYYEIYQEFLDGGIFFKEFPTLTGVWAVDNSQFPELFKIKAEEAQEKALNAFKSTSRELPRGIVIKNPKGEIVQPPIQDTIEFDMKARRHAKKIELVVQRILIELELYNLDCEKGFEISLSDLVNHYESTVKK